MFQILKVLYFLEYFFLLIAYFLSIIKKKYGRNFSFWNIFSSLLASYKKLSFET